VVSQGSRAESSHYLGADDRRRQPPGGAGQPHFIEEQGAQYEGLTVWFNSMVESAGCQILSPDNQVVLGRPAVIAASILRQLATSKGADPSLNVSMEAPGQVAFQSGSAAFMINYPFVWSAP
jgi:multiple sugar transport system substrate-binding protein